MQQEFDVVIRGGLVADGSGQEPRVAVVAICGEKVAAVGNVTARGRREINARDARGLLVTPGFVDIHTLRRTGDLGTGALPGRLVRGPQRFALS